MDKNKAVFKLNGFPHIYYLNLDEEPERNTFMETQLKYWQIENYTGTLHMMVEMVEILDTYLKEDIQII